MIEDRAAAMMLRLLAAAGGVGLGACIHGATLAGATLGQVVFLRSALAIPVLLAVAALSGGLADLRPRAPRVHLARGLLGGAAMCLNFYALSVLPVANASALGYLAPILSLPLAALLLEERLGRGVLGPVALGFIGMGTMLWASLVRPDWGGAQALGIAAGVGFAALMACVRVLVRSMTRTETTGAIALGFTVIGAGLGAALCLVTGWAPLTPALWGWMAAAGGLGALIHVASTAASRRAEVSVLAPLDYTGLLFAVILDAALFATWPGPLGWLGMGLISGGALWSALRRPAPAAAPPPRT